MKKGFLFLFSIILFSSNILADDCSESQTKVDFYFSLGYGGDTLSKKEVFPENFYDQTSFVNIGEFFIGGGYNFMHFKTLALAAGLEYQMNYRFTISNYTQIETATTSTLKFNFGQALDQYANIYIKANWWITPRLPLGVMFYTGIGFRNVFDFIHVQVVDTDATTTFYSADKKFVVGYDLGLRVFFSILYLEMMYTVFPNAYTGESRKTAQTFSLSGGFMFSF